MLFPESPERELSSLGSLTRSLMAPHAGVFSCHLPIILSVPSLIRDESLVGPL